MNTVAKETYSEFEERKSKFIGYIKPISSKEEAEFFINQIRIKHSDATHNVYAYKVIDNGKEYFKFSDDGEPQNTAGKPIAELMNIREVNNLVIVVTRYFGGIKLGAGGLIRNYAKSAKLAIEEAGIIEFVETKELMVDFPYNKSGIVDRFLSDNSVEILDKNFEERVTYKIKTTIEKIDELKKIEGILVII